MQPDQDRLRALLYKEADTTVVNSLVFSPDKLLALIAREVRLGQVSELDKVRYQSKHLGAYLATRIAELEAYKDDLSDGWLTVHDITQLKQPYGGKES